jgi:hypothetical protein
MGWWSSVGCDRPYPGLGEVRLTVCILRGRNAQGRKVWGRNAPVPYDFWVSYWKNSYMKNKALEESPGVRYREFCVFACVFMALLFSCNWPFTYIFCQGPAYRVSIHSRMDLKFFFFGGGLPGRDLNPELPYKPRLYTAVKRINHSASSHPSYEVAFKLAHEELS